MDIKYIKSKTGYLYEVYYEKCLPFKNGKLILAEDGIMGDFQTFAQQSKLTF